MGLQVYGASDDLIEIEGDIREEFPVELEPSNLAFSDGTLLSIEYGRSGFWHINLLARGSLFDKIIAPNSEREEQYSDTAWFHSGITWVVMGGNLAK